MPDDKRYLGVEGTVDGLETFPRRTRLAFWRIAPWWGFEAWRQWQRENGFEAWPA